jgi:hypothetical protein
LLSILASTTSGMVQMMKSASTTDALPVAPSRQVTCTPTSDWRIRVTSALRRMGLVIAFSNAAGIRSMPPIGWNMVAC